MAVLTFHIDAQEILKKFDFSSQVSRQAERMIIH